MLFSGQSNQIPEETSYFPSKRSKIHRGQEGEGALLDQNPRFSQQNRAQKDNYPMEKGFYSVYFNYFQEFLKFHKNINNIFFCF